MNHEYIYPISFLALLVGNCIKMSLRFFLSELALVLQWMYLLCQCHPGNCIALGSTYLLLAEAGPGLKFACALYCPPMSPLCTRMGYFQKELKVVFVQPTMSSVTQLCPY